MEIEAFFDSQQDCYVVVLWKGDDVMEKHHLPSLDEVNATINLLRHRHPQAKVIYGV